MQLPGLIDVHVHLREPGAEHKEDFDSGTAAALAGGFTTVLAMPNTNPPIAEAATMAQTAQLAAAKARCDYGIYMAATADNAEQIPEVAGQAAALKMYLDDTFGRLRIDEMTTWMPHFAHWPRSRPLAAHAERRTLGAMIAFSAVYDRPIHLCHVSREEEILLIRDAKARGLKITCEVAPHHLFLCEDDIPRLGPGRCEVRPMLAAKSDQQALWDHMDVIDCFATDHAPHLLSEKDGDDPPPGYPGLETALPLLLTAVHDGRLTEFDLYERMYNRPRVIFGLPEQPDTHIEVDPDARWTISADETVTRCGWTPFEGFDVRGRVRRVVLRGQEVYHDGKVLAAPGSGRNVRAETV